MQPPLLRRASAHVTVAALVLSLLAAASAPASAGTVCVKADGEYVACVTP